MMIDGIIYAFRDPLGIKPFCIGKTDKGYMVASESVAVDALNGKFIRDIRPGELVRIDAEGIKCNQVAIAGKRAHCIFEYIYFARADAVLMATCCDGGEPLGKISMKNLKVILCVLFLIQGQRMPSVMLNVQIPFVESMMKN
jgi:glutamine phosphoribosylpyrophosphate amidotransferase